MSSENPQVAVLQWESDLAAPFPDRIEAAAAAVRAQQGSDLVALPELWSTSAFVLDQATEHAQPLDGPLVDALADAARSIDAWVHLGSFVERAADGSLFNTSVLLAPDGTPAATYRKLHLFGFAGGEREVFSAGDDVVTAVTPFGTVGLATCYDLRFPELFRALVDAGAELVLLPSAWPLKRANHWSVLTRARAIEDQVVLIGANAAGRQGRVEMAGASVIVDPLGAVVAEAAPQTPQVLTARLDLAAIGRARQDFPVLRDRRLAAPPG